MIIKYLVKPIILFSLVAIFIFLFLTSIELYELYDVKNNGKNISAKVVQKDPQLKFGVGVSIDKIHIVFGTVKMDVFQQINIGDTLSVHYLEKHCNIIFEYGDNSIPRTITAIIYLLLLFSINVFAVYRAYHPISFYNRRMSDK